VSFSNVLGGFKREYLPITIRPLWGVFTKASIINKNNIYFEGQAEFPRGTRFIMDRSPRGVRDTVHLYMHNVGSS
jgi:hypothetical protein